MPLRLGPNRSGSRTWALPGNLVWRVVSGKRPSSFLVTGPLPASGLPPSPAASSQRLEREPGQGVCEPEGQQRSVGTVRSPREILVRLKGRVLCCHEEAFHILEKEERAPQPLLTLVCRPGQYWSAHPPGL